MAAAPSLVKIEGDKKFFQVGVGGILFSRHKLMADGVVQVRCYRKRDVSLNMIIIFELLHL